MVNIHEPLMEPPMRVPSQQHLANYRHEHQRPSQSPRSPVARYQSTQASSLDRRSSTPPSDPSDYVLPRSPYQQRDPVPAPVAATTAHSSRQGLEHEDAAAEMLPNDYKENQQQPSSPPNLYPGSSQSVLKLTTTKKVAEKKQALACLFCRERKIACGRPDPENEDQTCK